MGGRGSKTHALEMLSPFFQGRIAKPETTTEARGLQPLYLNAAPVRIELLDATAHKTLKMTVPAPVNPAIAAINAAGNDIDSLTLAIEQAEHLESQPGDDRQKLRGATSTRVPPRPGCPKHPKSHPVGDV